MTQWIVWTRGEYPHLLPHLVQSVISKEHTGEREMRWVVEMTEQEAEEVRRRSFVEAVEPAQLAGRS